MVMNVIRFSAPDVMEFLKGPQLRIEGRKYRLNKFILRVDYDENEQVWYNVFTGSIISLKPIEIDSIFEDYPADYLHYMYENYFIVPEDFDEEYLLEKFREVKQTPITCNSLDRINSYTILTTTECNARCFYCYQNVDHNKHHMTEKTARDVVRYIDKHAWRNDGVFLGWFGGEPLYNQKVIDIIVYGIISTGRRISSSMISNGYLMNEALAKKAYNEWHLDNIQITLDGTEEIYNKTKKYIYKDDPNPFKTVIQNIHHMLNVGMHVSIRINCGLHNLEDLKALVLYLAEEFKDEPNLSVYAHELFDLKNNRSSEADEQIFKNMSILEDMFTEYNLRTENGSIPGTIKVIHCMVDSDESTIISPGGELGLCEHYQNSKFYGHINDPSIKDMEVIKNWRVKSQYTEICNDCPLKPICLKLRDCPDHKICSKWEKEFMLKRHSEDVKLIYNNWKKAEAEHIQNECKDNTCNCKKEIEQ